MMRKSMRMRNINLREENDFFFLIVPVEGKGSTVKKYVTEGKGFAVSR